MDQKYIIYPQTKWRIFYVIFDELSQSKDVKDKDLLLKIITEAIHPLNLGGDKVKSESLVEKFNDYLDYDKLRIFNRNNTYSIDMPLSEDKDAQREIIAEFEEGDKNNWNFYVNQRIRRRFLSTKNFPVVNECCRNIL